MPNRACLSGFPLAVTTSRNCTVALWTSGRLCPRPGVRVREPPPQGRGREAPGLMPGAKGAEAVCQAGAAFLERAAVGPAAAQGEVDREILATLPNPPAQA